MTNVWNKKSPFLTMIFFYLPFSRKNLPDSLWDWFYDIQTCLKWRNFIVLHIWLPQLVDMNSTPRRDFLFMHFSPSGFFFFVFFFTWASIHCISSLPLASLSPIRSQVLHSTSDICWNIHTLHPWPCLLILDLEEEEEEGDDEGGGWMCPRGKRRPSERIC